MTHDNGSEELRDDLASDSTATSPLTAGLDLPLSHEAAYLARRMVADLLSGWRITDETVRDDLLLITSELVTDAVRHDGDRVRLDLELQAEAIRVAVSDGSAVLPRPREADQDGEVGRGLFILGAVTEAWGVENSPHGGKEVWARLRLTDPDRPEGPADQV